MLEEKPRVRVNFETPGELLYLYQNSECAKPLPTLREPRTFYGYILGFVNRYCLGTDGDGGSQPRRYHHREVQRRRYVVPHVFLRTQLAKFNRTDIIVDRRDG